MSAPGGSPSRPLPSSRSRNLTDLAAALLAALAFLLLAAPAAAQSVPTTVTNLSAAAENRKVTLSWTPATTLVAIIKYQYRWKTGGSYGDWIDISGSDGDTRKHTVTGLMNGTAYTFQVRAVSSVGNAGNSNEATATPKSIPGAPTALWHTDGHRAVKLHWTAPADDGGSAITKYKIRFNTRFYETENTSYVVTGQTGQIDGLWHLEVRAVNANGEGPAAPVRVWVHSATVTIAGGSDVLEGQEAEFTLTADRPVLSTSRPLNVSLLVSESETMVESTHEGAKTASFALGATTAEHSVPTHPDTTGEEDSDVTVAIQANADYTVGMAASAAVTVRDNDDPVPPTNVTITEGHHAVRVSWTAPANDGGSAITAYQVEAGGTTATTSSGSVTSHVLDSLADGAYTIRVRAVHASGNGAWSNSTSATVGPATVTIAGEGDPQAGKGAGSEYGWVAFTLTTDRPVLSASQPLNVSVLVSETEDMLPSGYEGAQTASFALNSATHILQLSPTTDTTQEPDSDVTAAIQANADYTIGTPSSATVAILDDDGPPERPVTGLTVAEEHYSFRAEWDTYVPGPGEPLQALYEIQYSYFEPSLRIPTYFEWASPAGANFEFRVRAINSTHTDRHGPWSDPVPVRFGGATVTIAGTGPVSEGDDAVFTLTTDRANRNGINGKSVLIVDVLVSETDDMVASANEKVRTVTFPLGAPAGSTVTLTVPTVDDDKDERDSVVTPTIQTAPSAQSRPYTVGTPASATVKVTNDDFGNFEQRRLESCGVSAPHSSGHAIECFQLVNSSYVRTPEGHGRSRLRAYRSQGAGSRRHRRDGRRAGRLGDQRAGGKGGRRRGDGRGGNESGDRGDGSHVHGDARDGGDDAPERDGGGGGDAEHGLQRGAGQHRHRRMAKQSGHSGERHRRDVPGVHGRRRRGRGRQRDHGDGECRERLHGGDVGVGVGDGRRQRRDGAAAAGRDAGCAAGLLGPAGGRVPHRPVVDGAGGRADRLRDRRVGRRRDGLDRGGPGPRRHGGGVRRRGARRRDDPLLPGARLQRSGARESGSAVANATTNLHLVLEGPGAPENLSASASGASRIDLSWTAPEGEVTGYAVEWSGDGETGWAAVDPEHSGTATEYAHTGLTAHTTYSYRVLALADAVPGGMVGRGQRHDGPHDPAAAGRRAARRAGERLGQRVGPVAHRGVVVGAQGRGDRLRGRVVGRRQRELDGGRSRAQRHGDRVQRHGAGRRHDAALPGAGRQRRGLRGVVGSGERHDAAAPS